MKCGRGCVSQAFAAPQSAIEGVAAAQVWTNMPAALTEVSVPLPTGPINRRNILSFLDAEIGFIVVVCTTAGATNAELAVQYSTNSGGAWTTFLLADGVTEAWCPLDASTTTFLHYPIPDAAKIQDLWLRIVGRNGDAAADPSFVIGMGMVNGARSTISSTILWEGDRPPAWKSFCSHKRTFWRGNTITAMSGTWTNMPSALTAVPNPPMTTNNPLPDSFTETVTAAHAGYIRHRVNVGVIGNAGATLRIEYSINAGSSWAYINSETGNDGAPITIDVAGLRYSSFVKIDEAFFNVTTANLKMRLVGVGGNGTIDPTFVIWGVDTTEYDPTQY